MKARIIMLIVLLALSPSAFSISFTITEIGNYQIAGINNSGQVLVQYASAQGPQRVGIWKNGSVQELGLTGDIAPSFESQEAKGINNNGQVIIRERTALQSYIWDNGVYTKIGNLPNVSGGSSSGTEAFGINDLGQVVGGSWTGIQDGYHAFLWDGSINDICGPVGTGSGNAAAINNNGQIVGGGCQGSSESFVYQNGNFTRLPGFSVSDINDNGVMAGQSAGSDTGGRAAIWSDTGLNVLSTAWGESKAINASGQVVGAFANGLPDNSAFLWDAALGILDLNDFVDPLLGIHLRNAIDINDLGQIIAAGRLTIGDQTYQRAYILTPTAVPIPPTIWLFGSGLICLFGLVREKQNSHCNCPAQS